MNATPGYLITERRPALRPLWVGVVLGVADLCLTLFGKRVHQPVALDVAAVCEVACIVYYFMILHRIAWVMRSEPDWWEIYTPAGIIWRQFVPLYGIYVLYQWLRGIEDHLNSRLGSDIKVGLWTFIAMVVSWLPGLNEEYGQPISFILMISCFYLLYPRLNRAIAVPRPAGWIPPVRSGALSLR